MGVEAFLSSPKLSQVNMFSISFKNTTVQKENNLFTVIIKM